MNDKRIKYIDIMSGILIILVVVGHTYKLPDVARQFIYSFHMPAFFAVYGIKFYHNRKKETNSLKSFFLKKIKRLLIPYVVWALIYAPLSINNVIYILYGTQGTLVKAGSLSSLWYLDAILDCV